MNCHSTRAVLDLRREGRLSPRRSRAVEAHLASCAECRALAEPPRAEGEVRAPEALKARLRALAKAAPQPASPAAGATAPALWPSETRGLALAAAALALVGALIFATGVPSQSSGGVPVAVEEP